MADSVLVVDEVREFLKEPAGLGVDLDVAHQIRIEAPGFRLTGFCLTHQVLDLLALGADLRQFFRRGLEGRTPAAALLRQPPRQHRAGRERIPGPSHHVLCPPLSAESISDPG